MRTIPLTQGKVAIVDDEDYEALSKYRWVFRKRKDRKNGYAKREYDKSMMEEIMGKPPEKHVWDHVNRDSLDNRKSNLRLASLAENARNKNKRNVKCSSKYKGVAWSKWGKKWKACICCNYKQIHIGYFDTEKEAALAYDAKAKELHRNFAGTNFI